MVIIGYNLLSPQHESVIVHVFLGNIDDPGPAQLQQCLISLEYLQHMRILLCCTDDDGSKRTTRIFLDNCASTGALLREVSREMGVARTSLIVRLKYEPHHLRIVDGWPLEHYPIRNGSTLIVQFNEALACRDLSLSTEPLARVQEEDDFDSDGNDEDLIGNQTSGGRVESQYLEECLREILTAVRKGDLQRVAAILREDPAVEESQLQRAIQQRYQYLLNQTGDEGRNALHEAISAGSMDILSFLLIKGADPSLPTTDDQSPLQLAVLAHSPDMLSLLLQQTRTDVNQVTSHGTALHLAAVEDDVRCMEVLFRSDADTEALDGQGRKPIEVTDNPTIRKLILKKGEIRKATAPFITRGIISKASSLTYRLKERTLLVNPFKNEFSLTDSKDKEEKLEIANIDTVNVVEERSWLMSSDYCYFRISMRDKEKTELILSVRHEEIMEKWLNSFRTAIRFRENSAFIRPVPPTEQLIQLLDDSSNQTSVHKRRVDPPKKTMSILNMLPDEDEHQHMRVKTRLSMRKSDRRFVNFSEELVGVESQIVVGSILRGIEGSGQSSEYASVVESSMDPSFLDSRQRFRKNSISSSEYAVSDFGAERGASFREFQIVRLLGTGSFGRVFQARWGRDGRTYALKVLSKPKLIKKKQLKYAVGEATILKKVDHPFVIALHLAFQTPQNLYLALDHCPHGDLAELITVREKLSEQTARFIIAQVLLAVEYLHSKNILYRDLKPENILIATDRYVRLTDFGLSRENAFAMSFCGSPAYLSPEMLQRKGVGFASDIYGIGCILFEMLVGEPPFFDENIDTLYDNIRIGKLRYPSHLSIEAASLIGKLLHKDPTKRLGAKKFSDIKGHDFFRKMDWGALMERRMTPPTEMVVQDPQSFYEIELEQAEAFRLSDTDYDAKTDKANRIKHFTFVRQQHSL